MRHPGVATEQVDLAHVEAWIGAQSGDLSYLHRQEQIAGVGLEILDPGGSMSSQISASLPRCLDDGLMSGKAGRGAQTERSGIHAKVPGKHVGERATADVAVAYEDEPLNFGKVGWAHGECLSVRQCQSHKPAPAPEIAVDGVNV